MKSYLKSTKSSAPQTQHLSQQYFQAQSLQSRAQNCNLHLSQDRSLMNKCDKLLDKHEKLQDQVATLLELNEESKKEEQLLT